MYVHQEQQSAYSSPPPGQSEYLRPPSRELLGFTGDKRLWCITSS